MIWLTGEEMLKFIEYNDGEAIYFDEDYNEVHPDKSHKYLVGLDRIEKNSIVYDVKPL